MRIAELSRQTGVPVPTIKYYLRENLLPPGEFTSPNQARYDERHVHRLRLIRALIDIGRLSIATIRDLLTELDQPGQDPHWMLGKALRATAGTAAIREPAEDGRPSPADDEVARLIARRGWQISEGAPARQALAEVITTLRQLGMADMLDLLDEYAGAAERTAVADLDLVRSRSATDAMVHTAVVGTVLGDRMLAALRHLAHEDVSGRTLAGAAGRKPDRD